MSWRYRWLRGAEALRPQAVPPKRSAALLRLAEGRETRQSGGHAMKQTSPPRVLRRLIRARDLKANSDSAASKSTSDAGAVASAAPLPASPAIPTIRVDTFAGAVGVDTDVSVAVAHPRAAVAPIASASAVLADFAESEVAEFLVPATETPPGYEATDGRVCVQRGSFRRARAGEGPLVTKDTACAAPAPPEKPIVDVAASAPPQNADTSAPCVAEGAHGATAHAKGAFAASAARGFACRRAHPSRACTMATTFACGHATSSQRSARGCSSSAAPEGNASGSGEIAGRREYGSWYEPQRRG